MRKIVHIDMEAFYASVDQRDDSEMRGKPVVVAWRGSRSVVCTASNEARKFGVRSAMPAVRAERLCPSAVFLPPDFPHYRAVSRQVREIFRRHTDLIEPLSWTKRTWMFRRTRLDCLRPRRWRARFANRSARN